MSKETYRCVATTPEGLVQQLAVCYLRHGYYWYVTGQIKKSTDPVSVDQKLINKYGIEISERERSKRKKAGLANMQYLRYDRWFILLATAGHHQFRQPCSKGGEKEQIRDCRRTPIKFEGYSISYRRSGFTPPGGAAPKWHACVRIENRRYKELKAHLQELARNRSTSYLANYFNNIPYARYAPIRRQLLSIYRSVNDTRLHLGFEQVPKSYVSMRRNIVKPFN